MPTNATPLITRLRRYLRVVVLLCLGLVVMKSGFAAGCIVDELSDASPRVVLAVSADSMTCEASDVGDAGTCWHDDGGGCHCVCAHGMPLLPPVTVLRVAAVSADIFVLATRDVRPAPHDDDLRPPIA